MAEGTTDFHDAGELRVKESDRMATIVEELAALGRRVEATGDGLVVHGGGPARRGRVRSATATTASPWPWRWPGWRRHGRHPASKGGSGGHELPGASRRTCAAVRVIAIDGPAGSGKSTVARAVAARLGLDYLDTGAMYRAVAFAALRRGIDPADAERGGAGWPREVDIEVGETRCIVDGVDATVEIRGPEVTGR